REAAWLRRRSPRRSSPRRLSPQPWRKRPTSTWICNMHCHRRRRSRRFERERLDREQRSSGVRLGDRHSTTLVQRCDSREQSTTSGIGSSRHAKACTVHLLASFVTRIHSDPNKSTASSGKAKSSHVPIHFHPLTSIC